MNKSGTINNDTRLVVEGDSRLHWRSQQLAESGGVARTRHDVELRAAPGSRNVVDVEVLTDGVRHEATNTLRLRALGNAGGVNEHRLILGSIAHKGPAANVADIDYRAVGGLNRSDVSEFDVQ